MILRWHTGIRLQHGVYAVLFLLAGCSTGKEEASGTVTQVADSAQALPRAVYGDCRQLLAEAKKSDSILLNQLEVDIPSATRAIQAFTDYAHHCKNDSLAPVYLIKTAQVARAVNNIPQAKLVLDHCIETYPQFRDRPAAIFLLAQLYDEDTYLNDEQEARKLYQWIIDEYPRSDWAGSAEGAIRFLGKSDEAIMRELRQKK